MPRTLYAPELRLSEHGVKLYSYWRRIRHRSTVDPIWEDYRVFYYWALDAGYESGDQLVRLDESLPYGPDNCFWYAPEPDTEWAMAWCKKWDDTVSKVRRQLGLPPL
jgi:hypothetical protein